MFTLKETADKMPRLTQIIQNIIFLIICFRDFLGGISYAVLLLKYYQYVLYRIIYIYF